MKFLKSMLCCLFIILFLQSCKTDYLNKEINLKDPNMSSSEIFDKITTNLNLPVLKSLNEDELFNSYYIDKNILVDYTCNISDDPNLPIEISVFKVKDKQNTNEVVLGIQERIKDLEKDFIENKKDSYYLIKEPYLKVIDRYIVFALYDNIKHINKVFDSIF